MNVEIGTEAAQFPEKKIINGIFVAVRLVDRIERSVPVRGSNGQHTSIRDASSKQLII